MAESIMRQEMGKWLKPECVDILNGPNDSQTKASEFMRCMTGADIIERQFAMPSKDTFTIKPISKLLEQEIDQSKLWIDPFAGYNSPAIITNDVNPAIDTSYHMEAIDFLRMFKDDSVDGVIFDPPYNYIQATIKYVTGETRMFKSPYGRRGNPMFTYIAEIKDEIARIVKPGGKAIMFGWSTNGVGKNRGFNTERILDVVHGGNHNDTLVTVEIKR